LVCNITLRRQLIWRPYI